MNDGAFPAIISSELGVLCGVNIDRATIPYILGSLKWLANENQYNGDIEDIQDTIQAFEDLILRLMNTTNEGICQEFVLIPVGLIQPYIGTDAPEGWLKCDGASYLQSTYPALVAKLPSNMRNDVAGTFVVPDMRGRMAVGVDTPNAQFARGTTGGGRLNMRYP